MGFLLGSCGVGLALTNEICLKGLPKTPTGEIMQFKGMQAEKTNAVTERCGLKPLFYLFIFFTINGTLS